MKDWSKRLDEMEQRLGAWESEIDRALGRARRSHGRRWFRKETPEEAESLAREARAEVGEEILGELFAFFDDTGAKYRESLIGDRAKIRAGIGSHPRIFRYYWNYIEQSPDLIRGAQDGERLDLALAAIGIDDMRVDLDLLDEILGRLWLAALRAGLDPAAHLTEAAALANRSSGGGGAQLREYLVEFPGCAYFKRRVQPELATIPRRRSAG